MAEKGWTWDRKHYMERTVETKCHTYRGWRTFRTWRCHRTCPTCRGLFDD